VWFKNRQAVSLVFTSYTELKDNGKTKTKASSSPESVKASGRWEREGIYGEKDFWKNVMPPSGSH